MILQYGTIPCRFGAAGLEVLLITSRETRRWVVPRGNPIAGLGPEESAAQETYEEAGVHGEIGAELGSYVYAKRRRDGTIAPAQVHVFRLDINLVAEEWPEMTQRERRWFTPREAADAVDEPDLKTLILDLAESGR